MKTCAKKADKPLLQGKPGRKRHACENCSRKKVACDAEFPCNPCSRSGILCKREESNSGTEGQDHVPFLRLFTERWLCDSQVAVFDELFKHHDSLEGADHPLFEIDDEERSLNETLLGLTSLPSGSIMDDFWGHSSHNEGQPASNENTVGFEARVVDVMLQLVAAQNQRNLETSRHDSPTDENQARRVFTAANLTRFTSAYFNRAHPFSPIVHRPTFEIVKASTALILAMFIVGAMHSAPQDQVLLARQYATMIEEYIFSHEVFSSPIPEVSAGLESERLEILQAAMLVYLLQLHNNNEPTRERVRNQRHPCLIAQMRALGFPAVRHEKPTGSTTLPSLKTFVNTEVKIRYGNFFARLPAVRTNQIVDSGGPSI